MLDQESQRFDLREIWFPEDSVELDTKDICLRLRGQAGTHPLERMGMVCLNMKLVLTLCVEG